MGDDRGAAVVEFAIILPILMLIIFGIIDFGTTYNDYQSLRSGVRDGTRDSVVTNYGSNSSCNTVPTISSTPAAYIICHVKDRAGLGNNVRVGFWVGTWTKGATLRVCAQYAASSTTGFTGPFLNGKIMTARVDMRIEQSLPTGQTIADTQETALSTWPTSCTLGT